jgi:bacterioferritin
MPHFVENVEEIRQRAMQKIEDGAVTSSYGLDKDQSIEILNEALATEIVCVLRYMHHYFMSTGVHGKAAADEFKEHADDEREHADRIAERIQQLGGKPDYNPRTLLQRSVSQYIEGESLADMIREDLIAERVVIDVYHQMIRHFGDQDPTTRIMLEDLLEDEEEHASDLADLLYVTNPETGETETQDPGTEVGEERDEQSSEQRSNQGNGQRREPSRPGPQTQSSEPGNSQQKTSAQSQSGSRSQPRTQPSTQPRPQQVSRDNQARRGDTRPAITNAPASADPGTPRGKSASEAGRSQENQRSNSRINPPVTPGTAGRVMGRRGRNETAPADDDVAVGGQAGASRSVKITNKGRKNKAA